MTSAKPDPSDAALARLRELGAESPEVPCRLLLETSGCAVVIVTRDGEILEWNPKAARVFGVHREDAIGTNLFERFVAEKLRASFIAEVAMLFEGETHRRFEHAIVDRDQHQAILVWNSSPIVDETGIAIAAVLIGQDVTEFHALEWRLQGVLDAVIDPIIAIDVQGIVLHANPACTATFGWQPEDLIGRNVKVLMGEPYRSEHDDYIARYLESGKRWAIGLVRTVVGRRKNGEDFPCNISISEIPGAGRMRFVGVIRDTSETEELSMRLAQAGRLAAVGELAAGVAHEINNPVNTIINCAQLVRDGDEDPKLLDDIVHEGLRIASIVRDLLDFSREPRDERSLTRVEDVVERTLSLVSRRLEKQGIELEVDLDGDLAPVMARGQQLEQVLLNLLLNARDALSESSRRDGNKIQITAANEVDDATRVVLRVRDNGPGIAFDAQERIFQPFFTTKRDRGGTGLGLSVSFGIIQAHDGTLRVASRPGEFCEFTIDLPAATA